MKKLFISQPMRGKTNEEIHREREKAISKVVCTIGEPIEVLDTIFDDFSSDAKPLEYLARSIEYLAKAEIALFIGDWENYRGCKIEHTCAVEYGIETMYFNQ